MKKPPELGKLVLVKWRPGGTKTGPLRWARVIAIGKRRYRFNYWAVAECQIDWGDGDVVIYRKKFPVKKLIYGEPNYEKD